MQLAEKQSKWQRLGKRLDKQSRESEKNQCREKLRHSDFLEAMSHAKALTDSRAALYTPYVCTECGFQHVGRPGESVIWMFEGISFHATA